MNQRIQELIRSADVHIIPDESEYGHTIIGLEKFAELIVRECISICKEKERPNLYGVREVEATIKEHFGVEE